MILNIAHKHPTLNIYILASQRHHHQLQHHFPFPAFLSHRDMQQVTYVGKVVNVQFILFHIYKHVIFYNICEWFYFMDHSNQGSHVHHIIFIILQASFPCFLILPGHVPGHVVEVSLEVTGTISSSRPLLCRSMCRSRGQDGGGGSEAAGGG